MTKTPEEIMRQVFESLAKTKELLKQSQALYIIRNGTNRGDAATVDALNFANVDAAIRHLSEAYDCISEIWENDLN